MNNVSAPSAKPPRIAADVLFDAMDLSEERDIPLTTDEVLHAPIATLRERLAGRGLSPFPGTSDVLAALDAFEARLPENAPVDEDVDDWSSVTPATLADPHDQIDIKRPGLVARICRELASQRFVYLEGPMGAGKSFFVKRQLLQSPDLQDLFYRPLYLDCGALRMREPKQLAREAVWAQFEGYDYSFRSFLAEITDSRAERGDVDTKTGVDMFVAYLQQRFADRAGRSGLIVFDHVDALDATGSIDAWLHRHLMPAIKALKLHVVFVTRSPARRKAIDLRARERAIHMPRLSVEEVEAWLGNCGVRRRHGGFVSAYNALALTGGRPQLLDDLRVFLLTSAPEPSVLKRFFYRRRDAGHIADCDEFVRTARRHPRVWESILEGGGRIRRSLLIGDACRRELLTTGAVRERADKSLAYLSYLHLARIQILCSWAALATVMARGDHLDLNENGTGKRIRKYSEYAADPLSKCIAMERDALAAIKTFVDYLTSYNYEVKLFLRDRGNARLWYPFVTPEKVGPFECRLQPDFARAIQTGECVRCEDGRWIIPIAGNSGFLEMVIWVTLQQTPLPFTEAVRIQALRRLVEGVQPTLAQVLQRWELQRDHIFSSKVTARTRQSGGRGRDALLQAAGCELIAVLSRSTGGDWTIVKLESIGASAKRSPKSVDLKPFEVVRGARLSCIAQHPSGRGVVLAGEDLWHVFPQLVGQQAAMYLHPIVQDNRVTQIVAFFFVDEYAMSLTSTIQSHLSVVASSY